MPQATVRLQDGLQATITSGSHTWIADEPVTDGGTDAGPSSTQMLLGALGACMAITVKLYAQRKNWPLVAIEVEVEYEKFNGADYAAYDGDSPFVYEFRERVFLHGDLSDEQKARLHEISKRCPVRRLLQSPAFFVEKQPDPST